MSTFRRSLSYLGRYKVRFWAALAASAVAASATPAMGWAMKYLVDDGLVRKDLEQVKNVIVLVVLLFLVKGLVTAASRYLMFSVGTLISYELRRDLYDKMVRLPLSFFERTRTGQIMSRSTADVPAVQAIMIQLHHCVTDLFRVTFALAALLWLHAELTLSIFVIAPPLALLLRWIAARLRRIGTALQAGLGDINSALQETVLGIREIKAFVAEDRERARYDRINSENLRQNLKAAKYQAINNPAIEFLVATAMAAVLLVGAQKVIQGELTPGWFLGYLTVLGQVFDPMRRLIDVYNNIKLSIAAFDRIFIFLDEPILLTDRPGAKLLERCAGRVEFRDVSFRYEEVREAPVLQGVNLTAEPGQVVAIVGASGSGKSTLVNLVPRFYDVIGGAVLVDGCDVRELTVASLRSHFGIVPQETILFSGTVADNLSLGRPSATPAEIERAARDANAHDFIQELPGGYAALIGERGVKLSGGQRQRMAIARALLRDPRILILDEATSALDTDSERLVQEALERLMRNRTTFVIAHRLSTITGAHKIVVLERGAIAETGTHDELLAKRGLYWHLSQAQAQPA